MLIMPSFKKSLIVEQFQGNYFKVNLNFVKFALAWLAREKQNILTPQPCLHTRMQTLLSANKSARTILGIL